MLVGAMYYFHEIYRNDSPGNAPLSESDFLEPIKIFKMTFPSPPPPRQMASLPSQGISNQTLDLIPFQ